MLVRATTGAPDEIGPGIPSGFLAGSIFMDGAVPGPGCRFPQNILSIGQTVQPVVCSWGNLSLRRGDLHHKYEQQTGSAAGRAGGDEEALMVRRRNVRLWRCHGAEFKAVEINRVGQPAPVRKRQGQIGGGVQSEMVGAGRVYGAAIAIGEPEREGVAVHDASRPSAAQVIQRSRVGLKEVGLDFTNP